MRVAVISDIHANLPALEATAEAIGGEGVDRIWCLGDLVGYGPHPNECCAWAQEHTAVCLSGNHDLGVIGDAAAGRLRGGRSGRGAGGRSPSSTRTPARTSRPSLRSAVVDGVGLYHGSPRDPVWEYVLSWEAARDAIDDSGTEVTIVGHSHVPLAIPQQGTEGGHAPAGTEIDLAGSRWLLNPGSVGQPRDGDPGAAWLLLDLDGPRASFRRTPYDVERTQAAIRAAGLPDALAERLAHGV